jgi:hypothetical protein
MNRKLIFLAAGLVFLATVSCSFSFALPTPLSTTPFPPYASPTSRSATATPLAPTPVVLTLTPASSPTVPVPTAPLPTLTVAATAAATSLPGSTATPTASTPGTYAVVLVGAGDMLNIRSAPGSDNALVGTFPSTATNILLTGPSAASGSDLWVQVQDPGGGTGWVDAKFLTEYVPHAAFCADAHVNSLIASLGHALTASDGAQLASLVSPAHGMDVRLYRNGKVVNYDTIHAAFVFSSSYAVDWGDAPGSGQPTVGAFHVEVLPALQEVFSASTTLNCDTVQTGGASYDTSWPAEYTNIHFYSVYKPGPAGHELEWRTILVGVEYVKGQPYIFSLIQMAWEP